MLIDLKSSIDARAVFERAVTTFSADRARPLWEKWARYEYQYGNLEAALKFEKRMAETYPNGMGDTPCLVKKMSLIKF